MFEDLRHYYTDFERVQVQPHEQRVVDEKKDLDEKLGKLKAFCFDPGSPIFGNLDPYDRDLLEDQYTAMEQYSKILDKRIARFVKLDMQRASYELGQGGSSPTRL